METRWERVAAILCLVLFAFWCGVMLGRHIESPIAFAAGREYEEDNTWAQVMERMPEQEAFDRGYAWACDSIATAQALRKAVEEHKP